MALTALQIQSTKPGVKNQRLSDGGGLYLLLTTKGQRWWRFDYRFEGKRKTLSLGVYPDVTLRSAREHHQEARRLVAQGIDPSALRQQRKASSEVIAANSFGAVATEWFERQKTQWSERHAGRIWRRIEQDILPWLGQRSLHEVRPPELLQVLRRVEERGAIETAHRLLQYCGKIFRYGVATGRIESDPCRDLRGALRPVQETHLAAVTEPHAVALLMRTLHAYEGSLTVRSALQLAPLVFVRPGELRKARWDAIDWERKEWRYELTKTGTQHIVPLSRQALALLKEVEPLTGAGEFVFPSSRGRGRPMSENTLSAALKALGYDGSVHTVHGFRAMARTLLDEELGFAPHLIEHQLGHRVKDALGRAYNRTKHLPARREMMQRWADYLEELRNG